jgi:hypothetical protein
MSFSVSSHKEDQNISTMNKLTRYLFLTVLVLCPMGVYHFLQQEKVQASVPAETLTLASAGKEDICSAEVNIQRSVLSFGDFPLATYLPLIRNGATFYETFDGLPDVPMPWNSYDWDITVHSRDVTKFYTFNPMNAAHGAACDPPPATHSISVYADAVFNCKNHLMTAIDDAGYGVIYLTPNQLVDFSEEEAVVRFDVSTLRTSYRDWVDMYLTPYEDNLQLPLESWLPDLSGQPRRAVHISLFGDSSVFNAFVIKNFNSVQLDGLWWIDYDSFLEPSATLRTTFELRITKDHLTFGMPAYNFWWVDKDISPPLDWDKAVLQLGHHSYNPTKDCPLPACSANSWHWDNVYISPALKFTMIHATQRYVDATLPSNKVTFSSTAPPNAYLRFSAIGTNIQVSFDSGQTWQPALLQASGEAFNSGTFQSYWMPIPAGISNVRFKGENGWASPWHARDVTIWANNESN